MSADPERLLHSGAADPTERELLASVRNVDAPDGAKDQAWRTLAGQLAAGALVGAAATATTTAATGVAHGGPLSLVPPFVLKAAAVLVAGSVAAGGYVVLRAGSEPSSVPESASALRPPSPAVVAPPRAPEPAMAPAPASLPPAGPPPKRSLESDRGASLSAESALLTEARAKLRAGDVAGASETLARAQRRFPRGVLSQEREVLSIEILSARGNAEAARSRARAFVAAHPTSPHSEKLRRLFDVP